MYIQFVNPIPDDILKPFPSPSHLEFIAVKLPFDVKSLVSDHGVHEDKPMLQYPHD